MRTAWMMGFGVLMFTLGTVSAPHLQASPQGDRADAVAARALLPEQPIRGRTVRIGGKEACKVTAVIQEWVRCEENREWRNLYNGASYSIDDPRDR